MEHLHRIQDKIYIKNDFEWKNGFRVDLNLKEIDIKFDIKRHIHIPFIER